MTISTAPLAGRRVLVVEDDYNIAVLMTTVLKTHGAEIVGPVGTVNAASTLVASNDIDGAVLDINLHGEMIYPVIDSLRSKGVRIVLMTGYDENAVAPSYADVPCLQKPVVIEHLISALFG